LEGNNKLMFPGKIAVVTSDTLTNEEDFNSVGPVIAKYGADKIIHLSWSSNFQTQQDEMIKTLAELAADRELKALVLNQALLGSNAAVDKFKETRDDVFIVYRSSQDPTPEAAARASLIFDCNSLGMGYAMVKQAKKQGAKAFVHYSFPRHMSQPFLIRRRDLIRDTCVAEGIRYTDATALDFKGEAGIDAAWQFILDDVPKMVAKYGEDTAFFCTNCNLQVPLIKAVVDCHAIFPQPCCPSPFHGFPEALGIKMNDGPPDLAYVISEASRIAEERNMTDRLSTWPVSVSAMVTNAGVEYAIKWINDEVMKTGINDDVLLDCMSTYIEEVVGEASNVYLTSYSEGGLTYDNFKLILMGYLDF